MIVVAKTHDQARSLRAGPRAAPAALVLGCPARRLCHVLDRSDGAGRSPCPIPPQPQHTASADQTPTQREHQRILAAYSGAYEDPRLEAMVAQTVDKLVAASERPDQRYRITVLNSPAINAFALPTGHLYVTRGLIALANDTSELASVLSHEMAHVIAQHAAMREDRAAPGCAGQPRVRQFRLRSRNERARARQIQDRARELLARAGIRGRRHRRRHRRARRLRSLRRGALPHLDRTQRRAAAADAGRRSIRARRISCRRIRRRPSASAMRRSMRASSPRPAAATATGPPISPPSTA